MTIRITQEAEEDLAEGFRFYETQSSGLGDYFLMCLIADIDGLIRHGGVHGVEFGFCRCLSQRFPYCIYYAIENDAILVVAVIDARRNPDGSSSDCPDSRP